MRGAARIGGRNFKLPKNQGGGKSYNPFEVLDIVGDLPVAPVLTPINDDWSWSIDADPADPRDCSRYPSSPYCGEIPLRFGPPFGYEPEIKTNGCETCVYIYPVIMWLKATPQVICYRDPNCNTPPPPRENSDIAEFPDQTENRWVSPACAATRNRIIRGANAFNQGAKASESRGQDSSIGFGLGLFDGWVYAGVIRGISFASSAFTYRDVGGDGFPFLELTSQYKVFKYQYQGKNPELRGAETTASLEYITGIKFPDCPDAKSPQPQPPPPSGDDSDEDKKRKKREKEMCCNECKDASGNTSKLLREIQAIKKALGTGQFEKAINAAVGIGDGSVTAIVNLIAKRIGTSTYPVEVPQSLLTGVKDGDNILKVESVTDYMYWLTNQLDALIGEFPIDIEIKDIDPLTAGDQKKTIQLTNIAETLAEIYGLSIKGSVNQEAEQAILLRLAIEAIAIKNGVAITQDYVKANTKFLGYRGNPVDRKLNYSFDFSSLDLAKKEQTVLLDAILKPTEAYVRGWENKDKETAADFFQKLMFSAGIIKAVFFRDKKQMKDVLTKADDMVKDGLKKEDEWKDFVQGINNPNSSYNKGKNEQPEIKIETRNPNKPI
jgi:hypothetical protein